MLDTWYKSKVVKGDQLGQKIGFPTLNFSNPQILAGQKVGVYAVLIMINNKKFKGVLYFGPRLVRGETANVLEINVFEFSDEIYGKEVSFQLVEYIRGAMDFKDMDELKNQMIKDTQKAGQIFANLP